MSTQNLNRISELIHQRNQVHAQIAKFIGRPALIGHVGEYIAAEIFDIALEDSAVNKASDGVFRSGKLAGKNVNIKWYGKQESLLDITPDCLPDYYLVMTGPKAPAQSSRNGVRPWLIEYVYLFDGPQLFSELSASGLKICEATSLRRQYWDAAEIYPRQVNPDLVLSEEHKENLRLFCP